MLAHLRVPVAAVLGALLAALALGVPSATASALPSEVREDREDREVIVKPREPRPDVFFLAGRVTPDYQREPAVLQRRNCGSCRWFAAQRFDTDDRGRFRLRIPDLRPGERRVCYRIKVPGGGGVRRAVSEVNCLGPVTS